MDKYYYLVAQLPFLDFAKPLGISSQGFLSEVRKWTDEKTFSLIEGARLENFEGVRTASTVLDTYREFEKDLRTQLAQVRMLKRRGVTHEQEEDSFHFISGKDPLEQEVHLFRLRWDYLDELSQDHFFDRDYLIIYYLKVQILERLEGFDEKKGREVFNNFRNLYDVSIYDKEKTKVTGGMYNIPLGPQ